MVKKLIIVAAVAAFSIPAMATIATFDWEEHAGNWWVNYGVSEVDSGVTLQAGGRAAAHDGGDGAGGANGSGFKASYFQDATDGTYVCQVGGVDQLFEVLSIDIRGDIGNTNMPAGSLLIIGTLGGVPQWTIDPTEDNTFHNYTTATTGDMTIQVDQLVWQAPYDPANPSKQLVWNNSIDNLVVDAVPEPATLGLMGLVGLAIYIKRKMMC